MTIRDGAEAMYEFMGRTGAMRFDRIAGIASVARKPTAQQLAILGRSSKGGYLALSLNTPEGRIVIVDDTEFDSASPRLIEDFFAQAQEKADRGVAGAWASRGKAKAGSRTSEVTETLSTDPQIGASFRTLTDAGAVNVVETVDDLPAEIRSQIDDTEQSRSPMKSPRADIKRGLNAMARLIADHETQYRAMFRQGLGWVDFEYGSEGSERIKGNGSRKGAQGIIHIMEARYRKDGYNEKQIGDLLDDVVYAIAEGHETSRLNKSGGHLNVTIENFRNGKTTRVALTKTPSSDAWVVTGFHVDGLVATGATRKGDGNASATHQRPTLSRPQKGAVATDSVLILGNSVLTIKHSDNGDIQGVYDPASGKSYLIASNLSKDTAKGVFLHEVGVHMAADGSGRAAMEPLIARAAQIVINGASNGDATAKAVLQRMEDAGLIETVGGRKNIKKGQEEEAFAYLAEHVVNNKEKSSRPIREWFEKVIRAIRLWLYHRGLFVQAENLTEKELVDLAIANVRELGREKVSGISGLKFSKSGSSSGSELPVSQVLSHRLDTGTPAWGFKRSGKKRRSRQSRPYDICAWRMGVHERGPGSAYLSRSNDKPFTFISSRGIVITRLSRSTWLHRRLRQLSIRLQVRIAKRRAREVTPDRPEMSAKNSGIRSGGRCGMCDNRGRIFAAGSRWTSVPRMSAGLTRFGSFFSATAQSKARLISPMRFSGVLRMVSHLSLYSSAS